MPLREDILNPIPGENPSGSNLRLSPVYDTIKEARREDDTLAQGAWQHERKSADHSVVIRLAQDAIATESKDLQLAAWLCESLLRKDGICGLRDGLVLCQGLVDRFWETLYPLVDDGELEDRIAPLEWISSKLLIPIKAVPLCQRGYDFFQYKASRAIEYEDLAKSKDQKAARDKALKEGKLAPELFDKSFVETPKPFYAGLEKDLDSTLETVQGLKEICAARFGAQAAPSFTRLEETLRELRHVVHQLLQKKRETEPDPVEQALPEPAMEPAAEPDTAATLAPAPVPAPAFAYTGVPSILDAGNQDAVMTAIADAAAALRARHPFSPAPYLMLRGLRWGELRAIGDPAELEAPATELRQQVKRLALQNKWRELLELAESIMALPCSRAWLDLQRFVMEACAALGEDYDAIAIAIRSEIRALLRDLPQLIEAILNDDTPAANRDTQAWLRELLSEPGQTQAAAGAASRGSGNTPAPGWQRKYVDAHLLAQDAMRSGHPALAIEILQREVERQRSGRSRFQRKLQLAQMCVAAGKDTIAQPLLDDIAAEIETHKLDDWEEREVVSGALALLMQSSKKIQADAKARQNIFERICRLDPIQALAV